MGLNHVLMVLCIFLAACQPELQAVPTANFTPTAVEPERQTDLCANVSCPTGQTCSQGTCVCNDGKSCGKKCIPETSCCTNNDCESGNCVGGTCAEPKQCRHGEVLSDGECECAENTTYCKEQNKCISKGSCCHNGHCELDQRCVPTAWKTSLCIRSDEKKLCRVMSDNGKTELFLIKTTELRAQATNWLNDGSIEFTIGNESILIPPKQTINLTSTNLTSFHEGLEIVGGYCKEEEEKEEED